MLYWTFLGAVFLPFIGGLLDTEGWVDEALCAVWYCCVIFTALAFVWMGIEATGRAIYG